MIVFLNEGVGTGCGTKIDVGALVIAVTSACRPTPLELNHRRHFSENFRPRYGLLTEVRKNDKLKKDTLYFNKNSISYVANDIISTYIPRDPLNHRVNLRGQSQRIIVMDSQSCMVQRTNRDSS